MPVTVYLDETGDHSLQAEDTQFPVFALTMVICDNDVYINDIGPRFCRFKMDYFKHEGVILHSRKMRRDEGPFSFLADPVKRGPFFARLYQEIAASDFKLISVAIRKEPHKKKYGKAAWNPYEMAMEFALERLLPFLEGLGQKSVEIVAEARGKREDNALRLAFLQVINSGNQYIPAARFKAIQFNLHFVPKAANLIGTQLADLSGFPVARRALDHKYNGPLVPIVWAKFYKGPGWINGLKMFP